MPPTCSCGLPGDARTQISDVVYSPKGHMVASGSEDGTLRLWRPGLLSSKTAGAVHQYVRDGSSRAVSPPCRSPNRLCAHFACVCSNAVVFMHMSHFSNGLQLISVDTGGVVKVRRVPAVLGLPMWANKL